MINTSLEITDNEYLIKFSRNKFDLAFIRNLLRIVEISNPSEEAIADKTFNETTAWVSPDYYSHLDDK